MADLEKLYQEFDSLCSKYGIPKQGDCYCLCLSIINTWARGYYYTIEEILKEDSAYQSARMLKQLHEANKDKPFSMIVNATEVKYPSTYIEALIDSIETSLAQRIEKGENCLILDVGYGRGGDAGRAFLIPADGVELSNEGFSIEELDLITNYIESNIKSKLKSRNESHNLGIGGIAYTLMTKLKGSEYRMTTYKASQFIFRFLELLSYFEERGDDFNSKILSNVEINYYIRGAVKQYEKTIKGR